MGLDMYLSGEIYLPTCFEHPEKDLREDGFRVKSRELELGYWRKHPDLHGFIVQEFADGEDNCHRIYLEADHLQEIVAAIRENRLPKTEGFFFGESENDQDQKDEAIGVFEAAIAWLNTPKEGLWKSVHYQASW